SDLDDGADRQLAVCCRHQVHVVALAAGGALAVEWVAVPRRLAALGPADADVVAAGATAAGDGDDNAERCRQRQPTSTRASPFVPPHRQPRPSTVAGRL